MRAMDKSIARSDWGETTTMMITPANSQCTQITEKTRVQSPIPVLKLAQLLQSPELPPPRTLPPTRPPLNSCIIVLTVALSMLINVRISFSDDFPQEVDSPSFFSDCKFNGGVDCPSNYTEGDGFGTSAIAMDYVRVSSKLGE